MPRLGVAILGAPAIHDGYRALANHTSSARIVIRLLAVTNAALDDIPVCSDEPEIGSSCAPVSYQAIGLS